MPADSDPAKPAPKLKPFLVNLPHHERRFLQALALIIESGKAKTVEDLIKYSRQANEAAAVDFLRSMAEQGLPVDLVYDAMCVHFRIVAHKRNSGLLSQCAGKAVGLVLPMPPHILDTFLPMENVTVLQPDNHHLPPHLDRFSGKILEGTRACRGEAGKLDVLVFEACHEKDRYYYSPSSADVIDPRILKSDAAFIVHVRPHRDPDDIPLGIPNESLQIL